MKSIIKASNIGYVENIPDKNYKEWEEFEIETPTICPCCGTALKPTYLSSYYRKDDRIEYKNRLVVFYSCPGCREYFIATYLFHTTPYVPSYSTTFINLIPHEESKTSFSENIQKLSSCFVDIYNQAEIAESRGLVDICGLGYRKALEFLVKDYAIRLYPNKCEDIKKKMLVSCINEYIDNKKIQILAKASAWIGNDETHYVKKHEEYNLDHFKTFINAIVTYVDAELAVTDAESLICTSKS